MPTNHPRRFGADAPSAHSNGVAPDLAGDRVPAGAAARCTAAQLRRFIKSRPYVPMHELRRRFELNGEADEVTLVRAGGEQYFVGLPERESQLIAELVGQGEIAVEVCRDPHVPVVVGLYAMRPIGRA